MSPKNRKRRKELWDDSERAEKMLAGGVQAGQPRTDLDSRTKAEISWRLKRTMARKKLAGSCRRIHPGGGDDK